MQRAEQAGSTRGADASSGKTTDFTATRRGLLAGVLTLPATAVFAAPSWTAAGWLDRWGEQGCGVAVRRNALVLKARTGADPAITAGLMAELNSAARQQAVMAIVRSDYAHDPAIAAVTDYRRVRDACVASDEDENGHAAWLAAEKRSMQRLIRTPARTPAGMAAKLRFVRDADDLAGDLAAIVGSVVRQVEARA